MRLVTRLFTSSSSSSSTSTASLSHGYELCRGCSRENPTMHIFSIATTQQIAFVRWRRVQPRRLRLLPGSQTWLPRCLLSGSETSMSPLRLSNLVTLMPEIDDISPGEARRSPARCPDDVIIARERVHCRYYFSSPENAIWRDRPARPVNKYMRARRGRSCPPAAMWRSYLGLPTRPEEIRSRVTSGRGVATRLMTVATTTTKCAVDHVKSEIKVRQTSIRRDSYCSWHGLGWCEGQMRHVPVVLLDAQRRRPLVSQSASAVSRDDHKRRRYIVADDYCCCRQDDGRAVAPASPATSFSVTGVDSKLRLWRRLLDNDALIALDGAPRHRRRCRADFRRPTWTQTEIITRLPA